MGSLLYSDTHTPYGVWFANEAASDEGDGGELQFTKQRKKITNIGEWSKAFATVISVYA